MYEVKVAGFFEKLVAGIFAYSTYRRKGYGFRRFASFFSGNVTTFVAKKGRKYMGTISVIMDGPKGLDLESIYPDEVDAIRSQGKIAEIGFFAKFSAKNRKACDFKLLQCLFSGIFGFAIKNGIDLYCIAINPSHKNFYRSKLLFEDLGAVKHYEPVNDYAVAEYADVRTWGARIQLNNAKFAEKIYRRSIA